MAAYNVIPAQERELLIFNDIKHYTYTEQELARENWLIDAVEKIVTDRTVQAAAVISAAAYFLRIHF